MAKFRQIYTEFWNDGKVIEEMTPEDKLFMVYLLTNPLTTQIGVYQITKKQMAFHLGYSIESINSLMDRFESRHKLIKYNAETREIAVKNWGKYNFIKGGKPVYDLINSELKKVKDIELVRWVYQNYLNKKELNKGICELFNSFLEINDTNTKRGTSGGQEEEEEIEEEIEEDIEKDIDIDKDKDIEHIKSCKQDIPYSEIINYLNEKAGTKYKSTTKKTQTLIHARWEEGFTLEDFKKVIENKCTEWLNTDMEKYLRPETLFGTKFEGYLNQKAAKPKTAEKVDTFNNYEQRAYDYDDLEKKLLGWNNNQGESG